MLLSRWQQGVEGKLVLLRRVTLSITMEAEEIIVLPQHPQRVAEGMYFHLEIVQ
jgi:hypothetical protein